MDLTTTSIKKEDLAKINNELLIEIQHREQKRMKNHDIITFLIKYFEGEKNDKGKRI